MSPFLVRACSSGLFRSREVMVYVIAQIATLLSSWVIWCWSANSFRVSVPAAVMMIVARIVLVTDGRMAPEIFSW